MSYYYITTEGDVVDSTYKIEDGKHIRINELEYTIARLHVQGYSRNEIENAMNTVYGEVKSEQNVKGDSNA